jgi:antitoxin component of RelBE/YafQ-DinJ toxin-antitoxin module
MPKIENRQLKDCWLRLRVTEKYKERVRERIEELGISESDYLRKLIDKDLDKKKAP